MTWTKQQASCSGALGHMHSHTQHCWPYGIVSQLEHQHHSMTLFFHWTVDLKYDAVDIDSSSSNSCNKCVRKKHKEQQAVCIALQAFAALATWIWFWLSGIIHLVHFLRTSCRSSISNQKVDEFLSNLSEACHHLLLQSIKDQQEKKEFLAWACQAGYAAHMISHDFIQWLLHAFQFTSQLLLQMWGQIYHCASSHTHKCDWWVLFDLCRPLLATSSRSPSRPIVQRSSVISSTVIARLRCPGLSASSPIQ